MTSSKEDFQRNYVTLGHPTSFGGISKLQSYYKGRNKIPKKKIEKNLESVDTYTLHKESKQLQRNPTFVHSAREQFQVSKKL